MRRVRLESVQSAADQGDLIAQVLGGADLQYNALPWFWSDQYDCKLQIAGLSSGYTNTVVRPGAKHNSQSTWYYADAPQARLEEALKERPNLSIVFLKKVCRQSMKMEWSTIFRDCKKRGWVNHNFTAFGISP